MRVALQTIKQLKSLQKQLLFLLTLTAGLTLNGMSQAPANDDPCNAITLTPDVICNYQTVTNANATATAGAPAPGCANYQGGDVWFQVTVPAASNGTLKFDTQAGVVTDLGMAIYRGTCDNLQLLACDDDSGTGLMSQITLNSLTIGTTLWVRCWEYGNNNNGTFGICVKYPGPPPAYDDPCNAIALPTPTTACNYQTFTDEGATSTTGVPAPGCANYTGGDVWFSVVVPAGGLLKFDTQVGEVINGGMAIYNGADCNNLSLIACDDNSSPNGNMPQIIANGLTPGSTVWIRFWSNVLTNNVGSFGICVSIPPPPPANDDPCNAILLTASSNCNYQTFSTESASATQGAPAPGCANYQGGDVWFKVVVPCDGKIDINTQTGVVTDGGMAIYRGTCDNLQLLDCDDDSSPNGLMPFISATSLTPGSTIYIRVWEFGNDNPGTFGICVSIPPPPPPTGNCFGAQPFCSSNTYTYNNTTNVPSLGGGGIYGCLGSTPNPAWFYLQVQNPGNMNILIHQTNTAGTTIDVDYCLWGPFANLAAACGNLAASNIVSCSYSTSGTETATLPNGQTGQIYVLLITNFANQQGTVTFNQTSGTGSTNCDIVCNLVAGNSGPTCPCTTVNLTATDMVPGTTYQWNGPNCFNQTALSTQQNPQGVPVPCEPGSYVYSVTATTPSGTSCFAQTTVVVSAAPTLGNDTAFYICPGSTKDLTTVYTTTGLTTEWTTYPGGTVVANPAAVGDAGQYQIIGTNVAGCKDTAIVTLTLDQVTFTAASTGNATCTVPGEITISNPVGVGSISTYTYNIDINPGVFQQSPIFTGVPAGPHDVITMDSLGCQATQTVMVDFTNDLTLSVSPLDTTICLGQSVTLHATSTATSYAWTPSATLNDATSANPVATPTDLDNYYTVVATLGACELTSDPIHIHVDQSITVDAGGPLFVDAGSSVQELATVTGANTNITSILWTPSEGLNSTSILNPVITPVPTNGTLTYLITVTNNVGCTATDELLVNILPNCRNVRNAFTPNGDGNNDFWFVYDDYSCLKNVTVSVFNRYGNKVFESKDYRNDWNGTYKGKSVPDATYYAVVEFTLFTGKHITVKTDLTILR